MIVADDKTDRAEVGGWGGGYGRYDSGVDAPRRQDAASAVAPEAVLRVEQS
jgi:hypothetical protein